MERSSTGSHCRKILFGTFPTWDSNRCFPVPGLPSAAATGSGIVGIAEIHAALVEAGFEGHATLEISGESAVKESHAFLQALGCE